MVTPWDLRPLVPLAPSPIEDGHSHAEHYIVGLDLGQARDPSALAIIELGVSRPRFVDDWAPLRALALRHLGRWDLGTSYHTVSADVRQLLGTPQLSGRTTLVVDATGAGRPVIEMLRTDGLVPLPVVITGGDAVNRSEDGWWRVPKRDLVAALAVSFDTSHLLVAEGLRYADVLRQELGNFRAKISIGGHDSYEAWREGQHDDLVLATALAVWWAEHAAGGHFTSGHVIRSGATGGI